MMCVFQVPDPGTKKPEIIPDEQINKCETKKKRSDVAEENFFPSKRVFVYIFLG